MYILGVNYFKAKKNVYSIVSKKLKMSFKWIFLKASQFASETVKALLLLFLLFESFSRQH